MLSLSPRRYLSCRHGFAEDRMGKPTPSSHSRSTESCGSLHSVPSSPRTKSETQDNSLYLSSTHHSGRIPQQDGESNIEMPGEVHEGARWVESKDECDVWTQSLSSLVLDLPHSCKCKPRSTCPDFLRKHFTHVQTHQGRCPPGILLTAYVASADAYAQSRDALSRPAAKLKRAKAEYDWTLSGLNRTLWSPRLQEQLSAAQRKIVAAEEEWESLSRKRWEKARCLVNMGRF